METTFPLYILCVFFFISFRFSFFILEFARLNCFQAFFFKSTFCPSMVFEILADCYELWRVDSAAAVWTCEGGRNCTKSWKISIWNYDARNRGKNGIINGHNLQFVLFRIPEKPVCEARDENLWTSIGSSLPRDSVHTDAKRNPPPWCGFVANEKKTEFSQD